MVTADGVLEVPLAELALSSDDELALSSEDDEVLLLRSEVTPDELSSDVVVSSESPVELSDELVGFSD